MKGSSPTNTNNERRALKVPTRRGLLFILLIALNQTSAADDEEPPGDTAREDHGDNAGKCHDVLIWFMGFMETGGGTDNKGHEQGYHHNPHQGEDGTGFHGDEVGNVLIGLNKECLVRPRYKDDEHE